MKINRLIDHTPTDVSAYEKYEFEDFIMAQQDIGFLKELKNPKKASAFALAFFLKSNDLWLEDQFEYNHNTYFLKAVSFENNNFDFFKSNLTNLDSKVELWGQQSIHPSFIGVTVKIDEVKWLTKRGVKV